MAIKGAIILGGHIQALGIIRILGKSGVKSIVIDKTKKNIARHSIFCTLFIKAGDEELCRALMDLGKEGPYYRWIIFPTNDYHVKLLSTNKKDLERYFIVSTDCWDVIEGFYNKRYTYKLAEQAGIRYPKTWFPESESDLLHIKTDYPCIIKPAVMHNFYSKVKKKVLVCRDYSELISHYRKAIDIIPANEIIVQEIIPGAGENQFSACMLFLKGKVYCSLTACRMRQHPIDFGHATTYAETVKIPQLVDYAVSILLKANYNGICEVEFKKDDRDGLYKFLEVNPRTWKWHSIANKADMPFLTLYYDYLTGKNIEQVTGSRFASFRHGLTDLPVQLTLFFRGVKDSFHVREPVENAVWDKNDIKPWIYEKLYLLYLVRIR